MACKDFLWKEPFKDLSQFSDNQRTKTSSCPPELKRRKIREPLWVYGLQNPFWVKEELRRRGAPDGEFHIQNAKGEDVVHREFPDSAALLNFIKACGKQKDLCKGSRVHANILERGLLEKDIALANSLLSMYAKCGALAKAQEMFDELPARNIVSWNALIAGYALHGLGHEALCCFKKLQEEGLSPNAVTFVCIFKACGSIRAAEKGEEIHAEVSRRELLENNIVLGTALVDMYAKCGMLAKAQEVFDELPGRDVASWTALIAGYAQQGLGNEALRCFQQMQVEGVSPNVVTFICTLKACGSIGAVKKGEEIHSEVRRQGLLGQNMVLGTALVDMFAKCGAPEKAQEVFDELPARDVASWSALIAGYAQHGLGDKALICFQQMQDEGLSPNTVTFMCILKACGSVGAVEDGKKIHAEVKRKGLFQKDIVLGTALVDMYAKCGTLSKAQEVFDELPIRDIASWTALIAGYTQHGLNTEALSCFGQMQEEGFSPNAVTFTCILKACGSIGAAKNGEEIHLEVCRQGLLEKDIVLATALVDMYGNTGVLIKAQKVFDEIPEQNVASWNALMAGYAQVGKVKMVFDLFIKMIGEDIEPNVFTFVVLLTACSHEGLVEEGQMYYETMSTVYSIIPTLEHSACLVDIFSRAGHFDRAIQVIEKVPPSDCLLLWSALLGACQKWANVELGRWAFRHVVELDEKIGSAYVRMSSLCAAAGMQEEVDEVEALRMKNGTWNVPGRCWWTDVVSNVHSFKVGDKNQSQSKCIYAKLKDLGQKLHLKGYLSCSNWVSQTNIDDRKEDVLCGHSEKFAIACALISTPEGTPIRVTKNARVCGDCHFAVLLISMLEKRNIQITDANRFHSFEDGKCVCEDHG